MADESIFDFIKDLTVEYYHKPKDEPKNEDKKEERKTQLSSPYSNKWFGHLPSAIKQLNKESKQKRQ